MGMRSSLTLSMAMVSVASAYTACRASAPITHSDVGVAELASRLDSYGSRQLDEDHGTAPRRRLEPHVPPGGSELFPREEEARQGVGRPR